MTHTHAPALEDLRGTRLLVAGGSSGIGLATACLAARFGAAVTIIGSNAARAEQAAAQSGLPLMHAGLDICDNAAVEEFFSSRAPFDHIVVTAARIRAGPVRQLPLADARSTFDAKFWGSYHVARHARFLDGAGSLTFVSGAAARNPQPGRSQLSAATAAIEAMTRSLAVELAPVRVNCIAPGLVDTPMLRAAGFRLDQPLPQPVPRAARPEEIGFQILSCAVNGFMTGSIIDLDGGLNLARGR